MPIARSRLDELLVARGLVPSRAAARGVIMAGLVDVAGRVTDKAGAPVAVDAEIVVKDRARFVSRGGEKLAGALNMLGVRVEGRSALDVGASTGGFVDALLQGGSGRVIALDVGHGQLDARLRGDPRVYVLERVNARYLSPDDLPYEPDFLTMDVSFISVTKVLPAVGVCMSRCFEGVILVKPQFEAGPRQVGKKGIVRDCEVHRRVLYETGRFVIGLPEVELFAMCRSEVSGVGGNAEFFFHVGRGGEKGVGLDRLEALVEECFESAEQQGGSAVCES
jgi:23S rRNA (cytidine1920-2'-O)/16S rRNA (cytidine1409-2'-O)-methyltransferase